MSAPLDIFLICPPGLEKALAAEAAGHGFAPARAVAGGVEVTGDWPEVWRANLMLRGAVRVLVRIGSFRAFHLAQLDKRARKFPWSDILRPDVPIRVEVTTNKRSKIYHAGAAAQRIETAIKETLGAPVSPEAALTLKARFDDNLVTFSLDSSGESLHKRGFKEAVNKAPMRETLAVLFLREAGYSGTEPVLDPMCGSGTFPIEAAEIAMGLAPGRARSFAFESLASYDAEAWNTMRSSVKPRTTDQHFYGSDRDQGAIAMSARNAEAAGVSAHTTFTCTSISDLKRPDGPAGLVIVNPPYGGRIGNKKPLFALHASLGTKLKSEFKGWRVAIITTEASLAKATGLNLTAGPYVPHGGLKVRLYQSGQF
ncbi:THUMP domain-containing class I SAM-dependent RNA methyltransferase [Lentibacter sp. XHP0401]|uniref:THUMP domain-containing class I SAM-dependent RNA methyltransferase n=1 Tax=Lentibacter sp. XHP0401 TaxID=2984334 RepID=UPI0021E97DA1|nr:class I SAM-dependent RNA methyltransferase [Lentibacter sp. XHP0401]MCV2894019.1 class I SAM-dependent RNA methyltransferase [Lentibacter sp. XHP0401]